jgi:dolichol kinase
MWNEIKRKLFHLSGLIYIVGLAFIPRDIYILVLSISAALILCVELVRLRWPDMNQFLIKLFRGAIREQEKNKISGIFWMILGVLITVALIKPLNMSAAIIAYLILGDGIASLAGLRFQGPFWPQSKKRISGSLACFLMCLFVGAVFFKPDYGWPLVVLGALTATILEGVSLPINDNLSIPAATSLVFYFYINFIGEIR